MTTQPRKGAMAFIFVTLMLDAMGIGLILPVMPELIQELEGEGIGDAAIWGGILLSTFAAMQFLFAPLLGALSDRFGRRPVLLISLIIMCIDYVVMALAQTIWLVFLTRVVGGITAATQSTASAYIADISPPEKKSANFGLVGAAFGLGFVMGPVLGGWLAEWGTRAPFWAAAVLSGANFLFGVFILPETVTDRIRRKLDLRRANPFGAFRKIGQLPRVARYLALLFLYEFAFLVYPAIWAYYPVARFGWDPRMVGMSLAFFGISVAFVQGVLIRFALSRLGERDTIIYGFFFNFAAFLFLVFVNSGLATLLFIPVSALGAVVIPALQGRMSRIAADDQQGELQGVIASARSVAAVLSPLVMTQIFRAFTTEPGPWVPGAPFALSAVLMVVCLAIFAARRPMPAS